MVNRVAAAVYLFCSVPLLSALVSTFTTENIKEISRSIYAKQDSQMLRLCSMRRQRRCPHYFKIRFQPSCVPVYLAVLINLNRWDCSPWTLTIQCLQPSSELCLQRSLRGSSALIITSLGDLGRILEALWELDIAVANILKDQEVVKFGCFDSCIWTLPIWIRLTHDLTRALESICETVLERFF